MRSTLLAALGDDARPLAGGHSLIPMMKLRMAAPEHPIDLAGIAELKGVERMATPSSSEPADAGRDGPL